MCRLPWPKAPRCSAETTFKGCRDVSMLSSIGSWNVPFPRHVPRNVKRRWLSCCSWLIMIMRHQTMIVTIAQFSCKSLITSDSWYHSTARAAPSAVRDLRALINRTISEATKTNNASFSCLLPQAMCHYHHIISPVAGSRQPCVLWSDSLYKRLWVDIFPAFHMHSFLVRLHIYLQFRSYSSRPICARKQLLQQGTFVKHMLMTAAFIILNLMKVVINSHFSYGLNPAHIITATQQIRCSYISVCLTPIIKVNSAVVQNNPLEEKKICSLKYILTQFCLSPETISGAQLNHLPQYWSDYWLY